MRERIRPTRSGLFAIELLAAVGVFILCAAVCVGVMVQSEVMSRDSADLVRAVNEARNAAECFKAAGGDLERTAALLGGEIQPDGEGMAVVQTYPPRRRGWSPWTSRFCASSGTGGLPGKPRCTFPRTPNSCSGNCPNRNKPGGTVRIS